LINFGSRAREFWCPDIGRDITIFTFEHVPISGFNADNFGDCDILNLENGLYIKNPVTHNWTPLPDCRIEGGVNEPLCFRIDRDCLYRDVIRDPLFNFDNVFNFPFPDRAVSWMERSPVIQNVEPEPEIEVTEEEWNALMEGA
jgi:hypothetical protein